MKNASLSAGSIEPLRPLLAPVQTLVLDKGVGRVSGSVSTGWVEYEFQASQGDSAMINLSVTQFRAGAQYQDNDTVIYLLDPSGRIAASNDDDIDGGFQSSINGYVIPQTGLYKLVVVTFGNDPLLDGTGLVTGWQGTGGSDVDFTGSVYLMPQLAQPTIAIQPDGMLKLQWNTGVLQASPDLGDSWVDVEGATSPWVISPTAASKYFYRLRVP